MSAVARLRAAFRRLVGLVRRSDDERAMREEMQFHLDQLTDRHIRAGLSPGQARRRARIEFGGIADHEEAARDALRSRLVDDLLRDLHYGWRSLRRHPAFALTAVLTIALGIAATVTVFTIVDSIFLRPLPVPHAERLVGIGLQRRAGREDRLGGMAARLLRARASAFDAVVAHDSREVLLVAARGVATERFGAFVSPDYFDVLGVRPQLGRFFLPSEDSVPDRDAVAVLGYDLWRTQFGADPRAVGEHMQVRGRDVTIVGVAPPGFIGISIGGAPNDLWLPTMMLGVMGPGCLGQPGCRDADVLARLAPGVPITLGRRQVEALSAELGAMAFARDTTPHVVVAPLRGMASDQRSDYVALAPLLAGIALLLIVIACANVGSLLVTRGPRAQRFLRQVVTKLHDMPDVTAVAFGRGIGFLWGQGPTTLPLGRVAGDTVLLAYTRFVSPGFLASLGIPLVQGREFTAADDSGAPLVAILTESAARTLWPAASALDRSIVLGGKTFRVVGVAADFAVHPITTPAPPVVLVPFWQDAFGPEVDARLAVRLRGDPAEALPRLRAAISAIDPAVPITELMPFAAQVDANYTAVHLGAVVLLAAAVVALFLTGLGLYGVIAYLVERRTREIGVRIAVGATAAGIVTLMLRQGLGATLVGAATGLIGAALGARFLAAYLVGGEPIDRVAFVAALLTVLAVTCCASYIPARRAARIDPMTALRIE